MGYTRQGYYKHLLLDEKREQCNVKILEAVRDIRHTQAKAGGRKLKMMLEEGRAMHTVKIGRDALYELLNKHNLTLKKKKRTHPTTNSRHSFQVYPNLLKDMRVTSVNQVWVSDITYLRTLKGFCYLSLVTDLYSRKILGYNVSESLEAKHTLAAFKLAYANANLPTGLIHHSDKGIQYCCKSYIESLKKARITISMTGQNHCFDNAVAERLNGILKSELGLGNIILDYKTAKALAKEAVFIYNNQRLHASLNYKTPDETYFACSAPKAS
jgi:transposase InsO family protein